MNAEPYDFTVIGGGSAGFAAARAAADLGMRTAVVEGGKKVAGLCILRGCMPSKTVIESANRFLTLTRAKEFGLRAENLQVVGEEIQARKRRIVGEFEDYRRGQLEDGPFDFIRGNARFVDAHRIQIAPMDGGAALDLESRSFLIATGSFIPEPHVPGLKEAGYLTSDDALELSKIPKSIVILGAGAIGLEAAHHLSALGAEVTVIQRGTQILREADKDVADALQKALAERGVHFHCGTTLKRVESGAAGKTVYFQEGGQEKSVTAAEVLAALGRRPCTANLDLARAGVELNKKGGVEAGRNQRSSAPHIYAAGDVCGPHEIVHIAIQQGELAARNAARALGQLNGPPEEIDYRLKLFCLFTHPQAASLGLTEGEATEEGIEFRTASYAFADHGKAQVLGETHGFVKLIADKRSGEIIGASVIGPEAAEIIHEVAVAMYFRAKAVDLCRTPHYHPTLSEIWTYPAEELAGHHHHAMRPGDEEIS